MGTGVNTTYDVLIIGAGAIGASIARYLSRYHLKIAVIEKEVDVSFGTSKANSGIIHAGFHAPPETLKGKLSAAGNSRFDQLCDELEITFERRGELMVAFNEEDVRILQFYYSRGKQNNVPYLEILGRGRTLELEPNLSPDIVGALYAPSAGIICPFEYCFALIDNAVENGVDLLLGHKVVWIGKKEKSCFDVETEKGLKLKGSYIVNAAGLYADDIASYLGCADFKIKPRKGEEYLLDRRVGELVKRAIFPCPTPKSKGMLVIPTIDGPVMVGPTATDTDDKADYSTTREGLKKSFQHAQKMVPAIRATDAITAFAGLRPIATSDDFIIGSTKVAGFINVAGIQSPGLTASPVIAEKVADILLKEGLRLEVKPDFNPRRKRKFIRIRNLVESRDYDGLAKAIDADMGYSKLVCRCETVTEAEVLAAIKCGHVTMDGIKFATRAGSGRCQGGFCTCRILDLIQKKTGVSLEAISKKGPGSEVSPIPLFKGSSK
jgi:glycerol-3-phosphate dehydrogenase